MIHVDKKKEPDDFYERVQRRGEAFLRSRRPGQKLADYWRDILPDLHQEYGYICAYACSWVLQHERSVDHFKPKGKYPQYAYHWDNYRLAFASFNQLKGEYEDVLDPFIVQDGWFEIHFPSLQTIPGPHLTATEEQQVLDTIKRLKLAEDPGIRERERWLIPYVREEWDFGFLKKRAPFLAGELKRQGLDDPNHRMWNKYKT